MNQFNYFKNKFNRLAQKDIFWAWIFILPALLGTLIFIVFPIFASFVISLTKWNLISAPKFVGLNNYIELLTSSEFYFVLFNTFYYAITTTILGIIFPLLLAVLLNKNIKGGNIFKTSYFIPFITPLIVAAIAWEWIFDPNTGILKWIFFNIRIEWLYDKNIAMFAIIIVSVWKNLGYNLVILLAGLQSISPGINEASKIDGAGGIKNFVYITLPLLTPSIFFVLVMTTILSFHVFDLIYLMTQGGPENSTMILVYWLYKNAFEYFKVGKASAIAYILFIILFIITFAQWKFRKKWVLNE